MDFFATVQAISEFRSKLDVLQQAVDANRAILERLQEAICALRDNMVDSMVIDDEAASSPPST